MIFNKLDACHCDSKKLVKETLSQMNRSKFRKDITVAKMSIVKTWNEKYKSRNDLFTDIISKKDSKNFTI